MPTDWKLELKEPEPSMSIDVRKVDGKIMATFRYKNYQSKKKKGNDLPDVDYANRDKIFDSWSAFAKDAEAFFNIDEEEKD